VLHAANLECRSKACYTQLSGNARQIARKSRRQCNKGIVSGYEKSNVCSTPTAVISQKSSKSVDVCQSYSKRTVAPFIETQCVKNKRSRGSVIYSNRLAPGR